MQFGEEKKKRNIFLQQKEAIKKKGHFIIVESQLQSSSS